MNLPRFCDTAFKLALFWLLLWTCHVFVIQLLNWFCFCFFINLPPFNDTTVNWLLFDEPAAFLWNEVLLLLKAFMKSYFWAFYCFYFGFFLINLPHFCKMQFYWFSLAFVLRQRDREIEKQRERWTGRHGDRQKQNCITV